MRKNTKKTLITGLYGNALEWYDFLLFAYFAPIFAKLFFPSGNDFVSLIATFGVFASGFLVRPIGAAIFGHVGDYIGRRNALIASITLMTSTTFLVALLPTHATIGIFSPLLLTALRLFQGIAISGELNSSASYLIEHAAPNRRGLAGSLVMCTAMIGVVLGSATVALMTALLSEKQLMTWGWRVPYLFAALLGIIGIYLRTRCEESPHYTAIKNDINELPLKKVFSKYQKQLILGILVTAVMATGNYLLIGYATTFLVKYQGFHLQDAMLINLLAICLWTVLLPIMGLLSDKIGRKPVFLAGAIGILICAHPIFVLLNSNQFHHALMAELLLGALLAPIGGVIPTLLAEKFPTAVRNSGSSLTYNISLAIFGGTAPMLSLMLVKFFGSNLAPAWYLMTCAIVSLLAWNFVPESHQKSL